MRRVIDVRNNELKKVMEQPKGTHTDIRCGCGERTFGCACGKIIELRFWRAINNEKN